MGLSIAVFSVKAFIAVIRHEGFISYFTTRWIEERFIVPFAMKF